jgi:hypothetical protein
MNGRWIKAYEGKREKARHALALKRQGETFRTIMAVMELPCLEVARQLVARGEWQELNPPVPELSGGTATDPAPAQSLCAAVTAMPRSSIAPAG